MTPPCRHPSLPPEGEGSQMRPGRAARLVGYRRRALVVGGIGVVAGLLGWRSAIAPVSLTAPVYSAGHHRTRPCARSRSATAPCATPHPAARPTPAAARWKRPSARSTPPTSRPTPRRASAAGPSAPSSARCAKASRATAIYLYPAFPYTAFAKTSDDDLQALYAYFMSMPAGACRNAEVRAQVPVQHAAADGRLERAVPRPDADAAGGHAERGMEPRRLPGQRPGPLRRLPHAAQRARRGAGRQRLPVGRDDRWLGGAGAHARCRSPPCRGTPTRSIGYLRHGHAQRHGIAGGPMAEVVRELAQVPDDDIRAMATYLASVQPRHPPAQAAVAQQAGRGRRGARRAGCSAPRSACSTAPAPPATTTATARRCWA